MKWPWQSRALNDRLVMALTSESFAYGRSVDGRLVRCGVEPRGDDTPQAFARRIRSLGIESSQVTAVLPLHECQLLQIDAPAVPPAELKSAARWRIKDLVDAHLDDLTLDVMVVGDGRSRTQRQLFVAAAQTRAIREVSEWSHAAGLALSVIDIAENAQRNLQSAVANALGRPGSASAALMQHGDTCLLTICAQGELFYSRRLSWDREAPGGEGASAARPAAGAASPELQMVDFVDYGSDAPRDSAGAGDGAPRFVIELQRSLDLWERSWPDLPLARLLVQMGDDTQRVAALLRDCLALPVEVLDPEAVFSDLNRYAGAPNVRAQVVPLLGALLRAEARQL